MSSLISVREAASEFGLSEKTIRAYCRRGVKHQRLLNDRIMVDPVSCFAFIQANSMNKHSPYGVYIGALAVSETTDCPKFYADWLDKVNECARENGYDLDSNDNVQFGLAIATTWARLSGHVQAGLHMTRS